MNDGEFIRLMRQKKGLTQEELGELLGVKKSAISRWESGERRITLENIRNISQILNFPLGVFLEQNENYRPVDSHIPSDEEDVYDVIQEETGDFSSDGIRIILPDIDDPELVQVFEGFKDLNKLTKDDLEDIKDILKLAQRIIEKRSHKT
ncbi:MAG: helix-turn-helix domain-containing protein [Deltaproteobacteria bacterium]|nr:helix-turn-helix domain-containing protein [Candidatus Zymogenaceae bacterium]